MDLYGKYNKSIPQKTFIHLLELVLLYLAYWILFRDGGDWLPFRSNITNELTNDPRRVIIFSFHLIIFLRLGFMMIFLLRRRIPWEESISVPMAFAVYYIGYSVLVLPTDQPLDLWDFLGVLLFITGCSINTLSELQRDHWKKKDENKGKLYTKGLFRYSRHINYFGDILWVTAYAILTRNPWSILIPVFITCFFAFYNAPKLDQYLKEKYGEQYEAYARKSKMLIPYVY